MNEILIFSGYISYLKSLEVCDLFFGYKGSLKTEAKENNKFRAFDHRRSSRCSMILLKFGERFEEISGTKFDVDFNIYTS